jgi:hypothetical protein
VLQVFTAGSYDATMFYTSKQWAVFKLSFGTFKDIEAGTAPFITTTLPAVVSPVCCCTSHGHLLAASDQQKCTALQQDLQSF